MVGPSVHHQMYPAKVAGPIETMSMELANHNRSLCDVLLQMAWHGPCVCVYVTGVNTAKTAEPIEMPFGSDGPT